MVNYALKVEEVTLNKRSNLILNVDGFIAVSLVDGFMHMMKDESEVEEIIQSELLNGFFVLGRTIGIIGHWNDQKSRRVRRPMRGGHFERRDEVTSWRVLVALTRWCARVLGNEDIQVLGDDVQNVRD